MLHKRISIGDRKVSPPQPTCMTKDQKGEPRNLSFASPDPTMVHKNPLYEPSDSQHASATYLANLRNNRPARPGGARPLPGKSVAPDSSNTHSLPRSGSALSFRKDGEVEDANSRISMVHSTSLPLVGSLKGRPLVQAPSVLRGGIGIAGPMIQPGQFRQQQITSRELEKQEAHSLREALEQIDHADDETRVYQAAQHEAADLVWKHLNPRLAEHEKVAAYRNPDLPRKQGPGVIKPAAINGGIESSSSRFSTTALPEAPECNVDGLKLFKRGARNSDQTAQISPVYSSRRRSSGKRTASSGSGKGVFRNPDDQIYEEPEELEASTAKHETVTELPLRARRENPLLRGSRPLPEKSHTVPLPEPQKFNRFELHRNLPTQSRNADYTANPPTSREGTPEVETPKGRAMEIRSDEIRAATSMKRKDRSPKLPTPTAVSDRPGRPIVSFDPTWRVGRESPKTSLDIERPSPKPTPPTIASSHSAPVVPTISLPSADVPSINITCDDDCVPAISVSEVQSLPAINLPDDTSSSGQPLPTISLTENPMPRPLPQTNLTSNFRPQARPLPFHTHSSPAKLPPTSAPRSNRVPWLSRAPTTAAGATVTCNACQLPIAGRIVTASGASQTGAKARLHPECFTCFHCSTTLECVSFYPEPESAREERLQSEPDTDTSEMRFYCHLDYHDLFSPRCASCKTPIEGAVILAAGKSWHEGHFFCAECGDPFSSTSPFVEDKGYAYCVGCHTKRTSARCRACKNQILDEISVEALGGKWHEECFRCDECAGSFGDDGRFFVREVEVELTEKEKRKGLLSKKFEERAVCHGCETLRLRRVDAFL